MTALILDLIRYYGLVGAVVAAAFLSVGLGRIEPSARASWVFRPLLVPGVVLLWPLVVFRWRQAERRMAGSTTHPPRAVQDFAALALAVAVPLILGVALAARQDGPIERPAVMLAPADGEAVE